MPMNDANELLEALEAISPAALTYDEWTMVGMGLKEAGLPVTVWENWSSRDGGRYHKGECVRKWESFHGKPKPITENSIFQLAYSHGWSGPAGHALDWGDELSAGPAKGDGQLVDPRWVESHELSLPEQYSAVKLAVTDDDSDLCEYDISGSERIKLTPRSVTTVIFR